MTHPETHARSGPRVVLALALLLASAAACSPPPTPRPPGGDPSAADTPPPWRMPERIDAIPGRTLILPLDDSWKSRMGVLRASFENGISTEARLFVVQVRMPPRPLPAPGERTRDWLPTPGLWSASPIGTAGDERGAMVLVISMPESPVGTSLRVAGRSFELNWLPTRDELEDSVDSVRRELWRPAQDAASAVSPTLAALAWPDSQSPITRWRYRLLTDGLRPTREDSKDVMDELAAPAAPRSGAQRVPSPTRFEDRVIESIARQNEERWRIGLARLWVDSPDLAPRLKSRLAAVCDFGHGVVAPAWSTDHAALDRLLADLLDARLSSDMLRDRVANWLADQPDALAWISDDAGTLDATHGGAVSMIDVANLADSDEAARVDADGSAPAPLSAVPAHAIRRLIFTPRTPGPLRVRLADAALTLPTLSAPIPLTPPGLQIGPLLADSDMQSWLAARPRDATPATAAVLSRSGADVELFVECRTTGASASPASPTPRPAGSPPGAGDSSDSIRVWIGPSGAPISVLRIDGTGAVADDARRADLVQTPADVRVLRRPDRWSFRIILPPRCVEPDGTLRLALTRIDPAGRRSTWPRAMLPWQDEPGRVRVDTKAWDR